LCILIFVFLESRCEYKRFWTAEPHMLSCSKYFFKLLVTFQKLSIDFAWLPCCCLFCLQRKPQQKMHVF
jgi:hypothetical protein